jgi:hypothetical protein
LDLYDMLDREIPLTQVLERKVRHAAVTGFPFVKRTTFSQPDTTRMRRKSVGIEGAAARGCR